MSLGEKSGIQVQVCIYQQLPQCGGDCQDSAFRAWNCPAILL